MRRVGAGAALWWEALRLRWSRLASAAWWRLWETAACVMLASGEVCSAGGVRDVLGCVAGGWSVTSSVSLWRYSLSAGLLPW